MQPSTSYPSPTPRGNRIPHTRSAHAHLSSLTGATTTYARLRSGPGLPTAPNIRVCPPSPEAYDHNDGDDGNTNTLIGKRAWLRWAVATTTTDERKSRRSTVLRAWRWTALAYCALATVLFTVRIVVDVPAGVQTGDGVSTVAAGSTAAAAAVAAAAATLTARTLPPRVLATHATVPLRIDSLHIPGTTAGPGGAAAAATPSNMTLTACLWGSVDSFARLSDWATRWPGRMSIVLVADEPVHLGAMRSVLAAITPRAHPIEVHILNGTHARVGANALLNLARVLASPDDHIVLFPAGLATLPAIETYRILANRAAIDEKPVLLGKIKVEEQVSPFANVRFTGSSVLLLPSTIRSMWCSDRDIAHVNQMAAWEACVWGIGLASFGKVSRIDGDPIDGIELPGADDRGHTMVTMKISERLLARWKEESCLLAAKRLIALEEARAGGTVTGPMIRSEEANWLRAACKDTFTDWGRGLL